MKTADENKVVYKVGKHSFEYKKVSSSIVDYSGNVAFKTDNVEVPVNWSDNAIRILSQKYMRKKGVPTHTIKIKEKGVYPRFYSREPHKQSELGGETSAHQVFSRLAGCWTYWGCKAGHFNNVKMADKFFEECYYGLYHQLLAPNSPQWFNTGLNWAYGIKGSAEGQPLFYNDEKGKVRKCKHTYVNPQIHACFIHSISDDLVGKGGIMDLWTREATVFKYGSGAGTNYSALRAVNEKLEGGGFSSGLMSFLEIGDKSAGAIKSGGTTRRAARLVVVDVDHPEVEDFIDWKVREENKVAALITGSTINKRCVDAIMQAETGDARDMATAEAYQMGVPSGLIQRALNLADTGLNFELEEFDANWESKAYQTVSGQNANNSISVTDEFMDAVKRDWDWYLTARTTGEVMKTVKARDLWDKICLAAWCSADPGLFFKDTVNEYNTVANDGEIISANPCIEYQFLDDTACNLASLNLGALYNKALEFLDAGYSHDDAMEEFAILVQEYSRLVMEILDISINMAQFTSEIVAENTYKYRTTGLGYANIGSLMMRLGMAYGDKHSIEFTESVTSLMVASAYERSSELATMLGEFPAFENNKEHMGRVIRKHAASSNDIATSKFKRIADRANKTWEKITKEGTQFRNAFTTCLAPTGTIGLVMDCDTTGIEPDFSLIKHKQLAGGGMMTIVNKSVVSALINLGYENYKIGRIVEYIEGHKKFPHSGSCVPGSDKTIDPLDYITIDDMSEAGFTGTMLQELESTKFSSFFGISDLIHKMYETHGIDATYLIKSEEIIRNTNRYIFGHNTVEGCDFVDDEHKKVFACAVAPAGFNMVIEAFDHINVMAAAQKYLSGAISKTVNMPMNATVQDVGAAYEYAYKSGVKAISIYRDGSKLSQPLMTAVATKIAKLVNTLDKDNQVTESKVENYLNVLTSSGVRRRLKGKRSGYTQKATIGDHKLYLRTGEYEDGTLGEIFIDMHKEGAVLRAVMNSFAIAVSIGLQYGVPLEEYFEAFYRTRFEPAGIVKDHDNIKTTSSILDFVFRDLAFNYLQRNDVVNIKPEEATEEETVVMETASTMVKAVKENNELTIRSIPKDDPIANYYTGDICSSCGQSQMVQSGTCATCENCGTTTGC